LSFCLSEVVNDNKDFNLPLKISIILSTSKLNHHEETNKTRGLRRAKAIGVL